MKALALPFARSRLIVAVFVLALSGCAATVSNSRDYSGHPLPPSATELKVLTHNIRLAAGRYEFARDVYDLPRGKNLPAVIAAIESADADVVALQEVAGPGQAKTLAKALNMNFAYEGHQTGSSMRASWWGVAILSRFPILEARGARLRSEQGSGASAMCSRRSRDSR